MQLYEIKKSKFYSKVFEINSKAQVSKIIEDLKKQHKKASHICSAFVFRDDQGFLNSGYSDDKEPKGSAGLPLWNLISKHNLSNVLIVSIRYFGGVKLGKGLLMRAYLNSGKIALEAYLNN
ncbi:IMPACT family protein [Mycoplasmopsis pulmonis]|uniref:IMPACT family protein n=1 Tax=Mycoplasmopsis pulmonis TaxID=2107 RepID=UPI001004F9D5|nr:YigZ family protein [Mycoplasmopsis pulmonis]VEU68037.1 proline dipeptidase pepQ [Mycoplasmopsis pulmonis]